MQAVLGFDGIAWPHAHDEAGAAAWLSHIAVVRDAATIRRDVRRQIDILRSADGPSWVHDSGIFYAKWRAETGGRPFLRTEKVGGHTRTRWQDPGSIAIGLVPEFTADAATALLAWPEDMRPADWNGDAITCCIAALMAFCSRLPRLGLPP